MGSIFRIAKAEFIKIFKRPTVYIMAFVLAGVIAISLFLFNPVPKSDANERVQIQGTTVSNLFSKFTEDNTYKTAFDKDNETAKNEIEFYTDNIEKNEQLNTAYDNLIKALDAVLATTSTPTTNITDDIINNFNSSFSDFYNIYTNITGNFVENYTTTIKQENVAFIKDYEKDRYQLKERYDALEQLNKAENGKTNFRSWFSATGNEELIRQMFTNAYNTANNASLSFLKYAINKVSTLQTEYIKQVGAGTSNKDAANRNRTELKNALERYNELVKFIIEDSSYLYAVINNSDYTFFSTNISSYKTTLSNGNTITDDNAATFLQNQQIVTKLNSTNYISNVEKVISDIIFPKYDKELLTSLSKTYEEAIKNIEAQNEAITDFNNSKSSSKDLNDLEKFNKLATTYKEMNSTIKNYVHNSMINELVNDFSNNTIRKFWGKEFNGSYNSYQIKEDITRLGYYLKNNIYSSNLDNVFAFNVNSGYETSAYDFMYFAIKISTLLIIVFSIFMAANIFASEHDSGTIKLLLMRPFKRHKIVSGKLLATLFFSTIFLLFSTLISFIIGVCLYHIPTNSILVVFNASMTFKLHPIFVLLLFLIFTFIEIVFYVILSSALCTFFKSYAGAITISFIVYFITIAMNIGFGNMLWYSYSPFVNVNLFKFLGNGFIVNTNSAILSQFFNTPLLGNMNYFISLGIIGGLIAILLSLTYVIFKRRDY